MSTNARAYLEKLVGRLTLGKAIRSIRQGEGESQIDFAKRLKVSKQYLCDLEHGRRIITPKKAAEYADLLGYSKKQFVRLCLQDMIDRDDLGLIVEIENAA